MALIHALMRLKNDGLVVSFEMIESDERAKAKLINGASLVLFMPKDYIVGITAIKEAASKKPHPDYIVYNTWSQVTGAAQAEAKRLNIPLVGYGRFRSILDDLLR